LLYALAATGLLKLDDDYFTNSDEASRFLVSGRTGYMGRALQVWPTRWEWVLKTATTVRTGTPQAKRDWGTASEAELEHLLTQMYPDTVAAGQMLLKRYDFSTCYSLLDVGGGAGGLAITLAESLPHMKATIVEMPGVVPIIQKFIAVSEGHNRVAVKTVDVVRNEIEGVYDVAILMNFIQVLGSEAASQALQHVGQAIRNGGDIYILGVILDDSRTSPQFAISNNLVFLNIFDEGQAYAEGEYRAWLAAANFGNIERAILPDGLSLIRAQKIG
jgi:hypothetical protein